MTRELGLTKTILVTGGAGYIGSHTTLLLLEQNYQVVVIDNCKSTYMSPEQTDPNGNLLCEFPESLKRVQNLAGRKLLAFYKLDLVTDNLDELLLKHKFDAVIHFAALKCVSESIAIPLDYYTNNLIGTINLLNAMKRNGCRHLIFSSSATVYGLPEYMPVDESHETGRRLLNPYGRTKYMIEQILQDLCSKPPKNIPGQEQQLLATSHWNIVALRYFNPVGAHPSGLIGEHVQGVPNNLMPYISQVSIGKREKLYIYGNDFDTIDGTGVRDYIHIMDLANGHTHALKHLLNSSISSSRYQAFNLGTGKGYSVLETVQTFEQVNEVKIPYEIVDRRQGDAGEVYADVSLARNELGWSSEKNLVDMVRDTYRWQTLYPEGFKSSIKQSDHEDSIQN